MGRFPFPLPWRVGAAEVGAPWGGGAGVEEPGVDGGGGAWLPPGAAGWSWPRTAPSWGLGSESVAPLVAMVGCKMVYLLASYPGGAGGISDSEREQH